MGRKEKTVHVGRLGENPVERAEHVLFVTDERRLAVQVGIDRKTGFRQRPGITGTPLIHRGQMRVGRHDGDPAGSPLDQVAHQPVAALFVVDNYIMGFQFRKITVENDQRERVVNQLPDLRLRNLGRGQNDPVDLLGAEHPDHPVLPLAFGLRTAYHQRIAVPFGFHLDFAGDLRIKRVGNRRKNQADRAGHPGIQAASQQIGLIVHSPGALLDPVLSRLADPALVPTT